MSEKIFRNTSYFLGAMVVIAGIAASGTVPDGAAWDERFVAFSSAVAPWMVSAMIVWAAGEIIKAMRVNQDVHHADDNEPTVGS